jgi:hypothetical protein
MLQSRFSLREQATRSRTDCHDKLKCLTCTPQNVLTGCNKTHNFMGCCAAGITVMPADSIKQACSTTRNNLQPQQFSTESVLLSAEVHQLGCSIAVPM